ncbi:MAG TPA: gliding motility-associated C-terminal domain-containing protein [Bacteroidales bacterium]|jgi:gliding motility-associated-like protein|nr:gliding motility-associated C-terminal domain-containing protein [Bacteroidales bacterium]
MKKIIMLLPLLIFINLKLDAQLMEVNNIKLNLNNQIKLDINGSIVNTGIINLNSSSNDTAILAIKENITNSGEIKNNGYIYLAGNWINNGNYFPQQGTIFLYGTNQNIGGTNSSSFYNLFLVGTGIKTLYNDLSINGTLKLFDSELAAMEKSITINNESTTAIQRNNGFISTSLNGSLNRKMLSTQIYEFPLGADLLNPIYRPVYITTSFAELNNFEVGFINNSPDFYGMYSSLKNEDIEYINENFFHSIRRIQGQSDAEILIKYENSDGSFDALSAWQSSHSPKWIKVDNSGFNSENNAFIQNFVNSDKKYYTAAKINEEITEEIHIYNSFSPNGDNLNDYWIIDGCEGCSVKIFNRNGNLVFESEDNSVSWDGKYKEKNVPDATYYYIITTSDGSKTYKGSVTIIR